MVARYQRQGANTDARTYECRCPATCYGCGLVASRAHEPPRFVCNWDVARAPASRWEAHGDTAHTPADHGFLLETAWRLYRYMVQTESSEFGVRQIHKDVCNVVHHARHMPLDDETCAFYQLLGDTFLSWSGAVECA